MGRWLLPGLRYGRLMAAAMFICFSLTLSLSGRVLARSGNEMLDSGTGTPTPPPPATPAPTPEPTLDVPILLYHHVAKPGWRATRFNVTQADFEKQMAFLAAHSFHTVNLESVVAALAGGPPLPEHPIVLTFDDGYRDAYTGAFPILKQHGFQGTFFLPTHYISTTTWFMSWPQVIEMRDAGMFFGSHTLNHPHLTRLAPGEVWQQVEQSRQELEAHLGISVTTFADPYGTTDNLVIQDLEKAGYIAAVTVGPNYHRSLSQRYRFSRAMISGTDSLAVFASRLPPAWLAEPNPLAGLLSSGVR